MYTLTFRRPCVQRGRMLCNLSKGRLSLQKVTAFSSEEEDLTRDWRRAFAEKMRQNTVRIHTNLDQPQNSTLARMISDAGGKEEMIRR